MLVFTRYCFCPSFCRARAEDLRIGPSHHHRHHPHEHTVHHSTLLEHHAGAMVFFGLPIKIELLPFGPGESIEFLLLPRYDIVTVDIFSGTSVSFLFFYLDVLFELQLLLCVDDGAVGAVGAAAGGYGISHAESIQFWPQHCVVVKTLPQQVER